MSEHRIMLDYNGFYASRFFWINQAQQRVDYIVEADGEIRAYEFKWNPASSFHFSKSFINAYNPGIAKVIHRDNYRFFVLPA